MIYETKLFLMNCMGILLKLCWISQIQFLSFQQPLMIQIKIYLRCWVTSPALSFFCYASLLKFIFSRHYNGWNQTITRCFPTIRPGGAVPTYISEVTKISTFYSPTFLSENFRQVSNTLLVEPYVNYLVFPYIALHSNSSNTSVPA